MLRAQWIPRLQNEEADALTNGEFKHFSPEKRIPVVLEDLAFGVLPAMLETGQTFFDEVEALRTAEKAARRAMGPRPRDRARKNAGEALRDRQPR